MMNILVVDDDPNMVSFLQRGLVCEGYDVETASDGEEALAKVRSHQPNLIILDVMMPWIDGMEVSRRVREAGDTPILMLTARGTVADKVAGLDSGADDYLVKPFVFDELLARIRVFERRNRPKERQVLRFGDLSLDTASREVKRDAETISLTAQEFDLLELFLRHPRQVLKREIIYDSVWGYDFEGGSNVIEVYIRYLRSKLEASGAPRLIHTVRGVGYVLKE